MEALLALDSGGKCPSSDNSKCPLKVLKAVHFSADALDPLGNGGSRIINIFIILPSLKIKLIHLIVIQML